MPECPYCGKWFKTKKGLQQHITKVHKVDTPFGKALDYSTFDFMGKLKREEERAKRRQKKSGSGFGLDLSGLFGQSGSKKSSSRKKSGKKSSGSKRRSKKK
ncbi:hypothetical protein [Thermococcus henrietii]|uniref:hypothetical protein n=1 Tax=Thermococcus henrietii TaxID=2016361 RepID=UPI000C08D8E8|nr:hypothetical protein [Thermococcus henrietii]